MINKSEQKHSPLPELELHQNVHPNTDRSPWGWVSLANSKVRIATWSGYEEKKFCQQVVEACNNYYSLKEENNRLRNDLLDALYLKEGKGPTALSNVVADRDSLKQRIEQLEGALIQCKGIFKRLADEGKYPEFMLQVNGGEGFQFIDTALNPKQ